MIAGFVIRETCESLDVVSDRQTPSGIAETPSDVGGAPSDGGGALHLADVLAHLELQSEGSFIDVELLAKAQRLGYYIIQFGVDYFPRERGTSTLSRPMVIVDILRELAHLLPGVWQTEPLPEHKLRER